MAPEARHIAALGDPHALPLTEEQLRASQLRSRVVVIRRALRLTQKQFSDAFRIPLKTVQDWEERRHEPDAAAQAYLQVIARDQDAVRAALQTRAA